MPRNGMVGEAGEPFASDLNSLPEKCGETAALTGNGNFQRSPHQDGTPTVADRYEAGVEKAGVVATEADRNTANTKPPDLLAAATRLIAVFDELKSITRAERIMTGRSDADLRREGETAMADLRAAVAKEK